MKRDNKKVKGPVPYATLSPGFEAIYTGQGEIRGHPCAIFMN